MWSGSGLKRNTDILTTSLHYIIIITHVGVCGSPGPVASWGSKRIKASPRGNRSGRKDVWYPARGVESGARKPRPQGVHDHSATSTSPGEGEGGGVFQINLLFLSELCLKISSGCYFLDAFIVKQLLFESINNVMIHPDSPKRIQVCSTS